MSAHKRWVLPTGAITVTISSNRATIEVDAFEARHQAREFLPGAVAQVLADYPARKTLAGETIICFAVPAADLPAALTRALGYLRETKPRYPTDRASRCAS